MIIIKLPPTTGRPIPNVRASGESAQQTAAITTTTPITCAPLSAYFPRLFHSQSLKTGRRGNRTAASPWPTPKEEAPLSDLGFPPTTTSAATRRCASGESDQQATAKAESMTKVNTSPSAANLPRLKRFRCLLTERRGTSQTAARADAISRSDSPLSVYKEKEGRK